MRTNPVRLCGVLLLLCTSLVGCTDSFYAVSTRGGNWLLVGRLPETGGNFSLAMTTDESLGQISGYPSVEFECYGPLPAGVNTDLGTSALAVDGSFSLNSPTLPVPGSGLYYGFGVQGTYPADDASPWPGSFTFPQTPSNCLIPASGSFTATKIADVTGVYDGTLSMTSPLSSIAIAPTIQVTLQQGGIFPGTSQFTHLYIGGTIQVQGSPCVSSGTSDPNTGDYGGDIGLMDFKMNDGSTWSFYLFDEDTGSTKLLLESVSISGGSCNFNQVMPNAVLVKQ